MEEKESKNKESRRIKYVKKERRRDKKGKRKDK